MALTAIIACHQPNDQMQAMQAKIDSLEQKLNSSYKSGLGEFMNGIQMHHAKLWFAGTNENWPLAQFEVDEINEGLDDIKAFITDRPEVKKMDMIFAPIDSVQHAIQTQNLSLFKSSYSSLTGTCNNCHRATDHAFNVITIPTVPPVSNQQFKPVLQ